MKNISRRVFIKGMAVAAVATAASTVLAGCNLTPVEETPVVGFQPIKKTLTVVDDEVIDVTVTNASTLYDEVLKLELSVSNKSKRNLYMVDSSYTPVTYDVGGSGMNVQVVAYFDGKRNDAVYPEKANGVDNVIYNGSTPVLTPDSEKGGLTSTFVYEKNLYFKAPEDWKTMTLVLTYYAWDKETNAAKTTLSEVQYVINK